MPQTPLGPSGGDQLRPGARQDVGQLPARVDPELHERVAQVPLHGARAEEEPGADVRARQALPGQTRDLPLLGGENVARRDGPLAHFLPRRKQLTPGPLAESVHPDRRELVVRGTEFDTRVDPAILAAQPLPVEQMRPGEVRTPPGPRQFPDRLVMQALGTLTL